MNLQRVATYTGLRPYGNKGDDLWPEFMHSTPIDDGTLGDMWQGLALTVRFLKNAARRHIEKIYLPRDLAGYRSIRYDEGGQPFCSLL